MLALERAVGKLCKIDVCFNNRTEYLNTLCEQV